MPTRVPRERETKLVRSVRVRLRRLGIVLYRRNVMLARTADGRKFRVEAPGRSDLYGWHIKTAKHFEIEIKADGGKPTPKQIEWLKECARLGAIAYWGDNINDIERVAEAVLAGGRVVWTDKDFHVEISR
jgi:hypothetical protein